MKLALVSRKGGVGKTTSAAFLARLLADNGRTLAVDADPDGSLLSWDRAAELPFDVVGRPDTRLPTTIAGVARSYDHVVIDGAPGDVAILQAAAMAAEVVVIPVSPTGLDLDRVRGTLDALGKVEHLADFDVQILLTKVRRGTRSAVETRALLAELAMPVLDAEIPLAEAYAGAFGAVPFPSDPYAAVLLELHAVAGARP